MERHLHDNLRSLNYFCPFLGQVLRIKGLIDLFADTAAILISIVSKDIMGCSGGQINMKFASGYPIITI